MSATEPFINLQDVRGIIRRRKWGFLIITAVILSAAVIVAFIIPPSYRSETTILVEGQQIPEAFVQSTVTSNVEERLEVISHQVLSRTKLLDIIRQLNLYPEMRDRYTVEEIVEKMRRNIRLSTVGGDVVKRRGGGGGGDTIAFKLSYEGRDPSTVQRTANVLASLYLEENARTRGRRVSVISKFLEDEKNKAQANMEDLEKKISDFKVHYMAALPENRVSNLQEIDRVRQNLGQVQAQLNALQDKKILLEERLSNIPPNRPVSLGEGQETLDPRERLKVLRTQLMLARSSLSEKHPTVKRLQKQIEELEKQLTPEENIQRKRGELTALEAELVELKAKFGPKHPDVVAKTKQIENLSKELEIVEAQKKPAGEAKEEQEPDNPVYIEIKMQLTALDMERANLLDQQARLKAALDEYERRLENTPVVEREYNSLLRDYRLSQSRYNDLAAKLISAKAAQGMEESQTAERFTIVEPAVRPSKPFKPNRLALILVGAVLALGAGSAFAVAREGLDGSIKTVEELAPLTDLPLLASVPIMDTDREQWNRRLRWIIVVGCAILFIVIALISVHLMVMPLDILIIKLQKRMLLLT